MLVIVLMLGISAAETALQGAKSARSERDRQLAFQSAEAALVDAELDIQGLPDSVLPRSDRFSANGFNGLDLDEDAGCGMDDDNASWGVCLPAPPGKLPVWRGVDFTDESGRGAVPYGRFTEKQFPAQGGGMPARLPGYIAEVRRYTGAGESAEAGDESYFYRVTAVGTGMQGTTQVALQGFYRKAE
jgi:type IV pilus assembly protein PilX